jgi:hypothetical protein
MKCRPPCDLFETCDMFYPTSTCSTSGTKVCGCFSPCKLDYECQYTGGFNYWCDVASGRCIECDASKSCSDSYVCRFNQCTSCKTDDQCKAEHPAKPVCSASKGLCVDCRTDAECKDPKYPNCSAAGTCTECGDDLDCKTPGLPHCASTGKCVQCGGDLDCSALTLKHCSTAGSCVECTQSSQCTPPKTCSANQCKLVKKAACEICDKSLNECGTGLVCAPSDTSGSNYKCRKACSKTDEYDPVCDPTDYPPFNYCSITVGYCYCS